MRLPDDALAVNRKLQATYNHKRIYRLMRLMGLKSVTRKKRKQYKKSTPQHVAGNLLNREFVAAKKNEKWLTDVTEFKYGDGQKAYLSAILDLYDTALLRMNQTFPVCALSVSSAETSRLLKLTDQKL